MLNITSVFLDIAPYPRYAPTIAIVVVIVVVAVVAVLLIRRALKKRK